MIHLYKLGVVISGIFLVTSCADLDPLEFKVDKPESIALQEEIDQYEDLKTYVEKDANPNFKLGAAVSISEYLQEGVMNRLVNRNFDEVTAGYGMKHGAVVQENGSLNLASVANFLESTNEAGISVYGHTLVWHANQNAEYLNTLLEPTVDPGSQIPTWDPVVEFDFETDDATGYEGNAGAILTFTADGEGANGEGRALKVTNEEVRANEWDSQIYLSFSPEMIVGEMYELSMDVRSDAPASSATQAQSAPGGYLHWDFFGAIATDAEWATFTKQVTVSELTAGTKTIAINLGNTATSYYFDNIKLTKYNEGGGGGPSLDPSVITTTDFESGVGGWGGWGGASTRGISADGEGYGDTGFAFTFTNPAVLNPWEAQIAYDFAEPLEEGSKYVLNFMVRSSVDGGISAGLQDPSDYSGAGDFPSFNITTEWKEITLETVVSGDNATRFLFNFGAYVGTIYIDDVTLRRENPNGGAPEKTPEEKREIIANEMERWIAGMLEVSKEYVKAWDVVNEPMDDGNPFELKTGVGRTLAADEFYWQDYMGKDYAVEAFRLAREYGNADDIHFINDYNLEYNLDKCRGIIQLVEYIEGKGEVVDGIGTQMHISIDSDKEKIIEMFELLAATGKLIKISELDIGVGVTTNLATAEHYEDQKAMYRFVVEKYIELIPAAQRYGITIWSPMDSPENSSWRAGEPIGLWTENYTRKPAYVGVVEGLGGVE